MMIIRIKYEGRFFFFLSLKITFIKSFLNFNKKFSICMHISKEKYLPISKKERISVLKLCKEITIAPLYSSQTTEEQSIQI